MLTTMSKADKQRLERLFELGPHLNGSDKKLIERAYFFCKKVHRGQKRFSGKPYFLHPYKAALKLAELGMDAHTIAAGFLHDTIEDGATTSKEIEDLFGPEILYLVEGVTKLGKLKYHGLKRHTESLRKLFVAMSHDIRVLIIKLADRLHNMKTLEHVPKEKQRRIALETLEIYAPLSHRLGIGQLKGELEDLSFPYVYPNAHKQVTELLKQNSKGSLKRLERLSRILRRRMAEEKIKIVQSDYRIKHLFSLYKKLSEKEMNIDKVYDIAALRVIVPTVDDCYKTLGIIHNRWKPLPTRIKDYISVPKPNGYQSLHTTVFTGDGAIVEIQIRTPEMHKEAEFGIASHVSYKEGLSTDKQSWIDRILRPLGGGDEPESIETPDWLQKLVEAQKTVDSPQEFLQNLRSDFFGDRVFVFTPKGEVIDLPEGATPIDFAYAVHSDLGDHLSGVKINKKFVSIEKKLENGDIVEIETKKSSHPTRKWLEYAHTTIARRHIRNYLSKN